MDNKNSRVERKKREKEKHKHEGSATLHNIASVCRIGNLIIGIINLING